MANFANTQSIKKSGMNLIPMNLGDCVKVLDLGRKDLSNNVLREREHSTSSTLMTFPSIDAVRALTPKSCVNNENKRMTLIERKSRLVAIASPTRET
jgi:hypothetical protein